jgi:hypothetical protein
LESELQKLEDLIIEITKKRISRKWFSDNLSNWSNTKIFDITERNEDEFYHEKNLEFIDFRKINNNFSSIISDKNKLLLELYNKNLIQNRLNENLKNNVVSSDDEKEYEMGSLW